MTRRFKLAIVRARSDPNESVIPDRACLDMLMTGQQSVLRYWSDTTGGWFDFLDSAMLPWVDITVPEADRSRGKQAALAVAAVRAANPGFDPFAGFDGALVITHPGRMSIPNPDAGKPGAPATIVVGFDGGSTAVGSLRTAVVPVMTSDHTFMCHELGHVLGANHSFGVLNNGTDWDEKDAIIALEPEYGSPYDLMSSAAFGSRWLGTGPFWRSSPVFVGTTVAGWPNMSAFTKGPNMARANLHRWFPESLDPDHAVHRQFPDGDDVGQVRLLAPTPDAVGTLLVLHPPGEPNTGVGRVYVEYREGRGWDQGLEVIGTDLAKTGVVVHTLEDTEKGPSIWYRGVIPMGSVDTDLVVAARPVVITLDSVEDEDGRGRVEISYRRATAAAATVRTANIEEVILGNVGATTAKQTPCGQTISWGVWALTTTTHFEVSTTGLGGAPGGEPPPAPVVRWTVGGVALPATQGSVEVPFDGTTFTVEYTIDQVSFELTLSTASGGQRFEAVAEATVTVGTETAAASAVFRSRGFFEGYQPEDEKTLGDCFASLFDRANQRHLAPRFRIPVPRPPGFAVAPWREDTLALLRDLQLPQPFASTVESLVLLQAPPDRDPAPDDTSTTTFDALLRARIDFSVPEQDLRDWLANPEFTPYPALAAALLHLLGGRRLRQPVFVDVIAFNYEHAPGASSPRHLDDVHLGVLRAAVLEGSNERHGTSESDFQSLVE
jgi:hypothetical protein